MATLQRLAHKYPNYKGSIGLLLLLGFFLLSACTTTHQEETDKLNETAYSFHYRNLDSTAVYAKRALGSSVGYDAGQAEALNNLAFVSIMTMNYKEAYQRLDSVAMLTDNQVELLVADVQLMRLCQRESHNKEFYDHMESANRRVKRIAEEYAMLTDHQQRRMVYALSEYDIVSSTYYYYVGLEQLSVEALQKIGERRETEDDTAQYLAYLYNVGAGGIITGSSQEEVYQQEFDYLMRCYMTARQEGYPFWEANSLQAISEHLAVAQYRDKLIQDNLPAMKFINTDLMPDSLLAGNLAQRSLEIFQKYGDVYQIAGSYRTLATCYFQIGDYESAIICLHKALGSKRIYQAPDLVASIREQLSVAYSAINDKPKSDYNRNIYLDLQDQTRQDRYLESRAEQLDRSSRQLNFMIAAVIVLIVVVVVLLFVFNYLRHRGDRANTMQALLEPLRAWQEHNERYMDELEGRYEEINEANQLNMLHVSNNKRRNLEQRAKISLVNSITPFIDRILHEIRRLRLVEEDELVRQERYAYIAELTDKINDYNNVLTEWIQMRQGELNLHIESFPVQSLFDIVRRSKMGFQLKGIELDVHDTDAVVKADRILTLFMINTIADNARKFTPEGGCVVISAESAEDYVEISVADNGRGMSGDQLAHVFDHKPIIDESGVSADAQSHGFGLVNCKGIIEKYKKISQKFSVCLLAAESKAGQGSRFYFRLPKGIVRLLVLLMSCGSMMSQAAVLSPLDLAAVYADSAYYSNINGEYARTLDFADSCRHYLNQYYLSQHPNGRELLVAEGDASSEMAEIKWFHDSLRTNYSVILDMRNESAVAALALHRWSLYRYNNKVYTQLYKETSADNQLRDYCQVMQQSESDKTVAVILLIILLLSIFPAYYLIYYRHRLYEQFCLERIRHINEILLSDHQATEKLSRISEIASDRFPDEQQQVVQLIITALRQSVDRSTVSQTNIELAEDERRRTEMENAKLHISNSVLDNCLSTLKHETMYYPSRIHQLIDGTDANLSSIEELAAYYKELYMILSQQAMRQVSTVKAHVSRVELKDILPANVLWHGADSMQVADATDQQKPLQVIGDPTLLRYLFEILQKENGGKLTDVEVVVKDDRYVCFQVLMPQLHLTEEQCLDLFTPAMSHIPYLLCRQITRENGESTGHRGCGIVAEATERGTLLTVSLAKG